MFHRKITPNASVHSTDVGEIALRAFLSTHHEALGHTAVLLADRRGARLINAIRDGINQPGPLTRRLLFELRGLLFLEHVDSDDWDDAGCFAMPDPCDPIVPEICLLADGLDDALRGAGLVPASDDCAA
ncbi:hypothetical protein [Primorskyibacter flagellatus]|uniref:Uncharacterized protein n=1 Tax=Primorskyibacter flagellatus TaxID=1387277 RepID=A0A1W2BUU5_9RHOB|nr:hypothetical protein [Primorskyibacter flagellatus]SMC76651.1 hypothetical protein SAMN06295998_1052 [Primorskyibacter flagellatus]